VLHTTLLQKRNTQNVNDYDVGAADEGGVEGSGAGTGAGLGVGSVTTGHSTE
jgi:hypothetical protein